MSRPKGDARERVLAAAVDYFATNGLGDPSLRQIAEALGTSHRMLIYHFGSKEGLLLEAVRSLEQHYQELVQEWTNEDLGVLAPVEELRRIWRFVTDPARAPYQFDRLFFELYGHALQGRPHADGFAEGNVKAWVDVVSQIFRSAGVPAKTAQTEARLTVAVIRGLLMDFLATDDWAAANRSLERFLSHCDAWLTETATSKASGRARPARRVS